MSRVKKRNLAKHVKARSQYEVQRHGAGAHLDDIKAKDARAGP